MLWQPSTFYSCHKKCMVIYKTMKPLLQTKITLWRPLSGRRPRAAVLRSNRRPDSWLTLRWSSHHPSFISSFQTSLTSHKMDLWDESKRTSAAFQLSFQVIHQTRSGLNSPPLSSDKVLKFFHRFIFTTVGETFKRPEKNKHQKTLTDLSTNAVWQEEKCHGKGWSKWFFALLHLCEPELQRQIILLLRAAASLPELTLLLSARCQHRHWRKQLREKCCFMLKEQWHFHCLFI